MAEDTGHATAGEAGLMAKEAGVSCLITGHYSSRYKEVTELLNEAGLHFPHVLESIEGKKYNLRQLGAV
jgi:ribonuclease Z